MINLKEKFPRLSKPPIVEAAFDIRIVSSVKWDETTLQNELRQRLSDFPKIEVIRQKRVQIFPQGKQADPSFEDSGCVGFKLHSKNNLHIVQFNKDSYVFSRLMPYEDWEHFSQEAFRLWAIYCELLKPTEVSRIGLRFINRISIKQETVELADYYKYPPESLKDLNWQLTGYLHHDVIRVPETLYSVNVIKTVQHIPKEIGLILDIDVFRQEQFEYDELQLIECLKEMRWVKNKVFFNSLTDKALSGFK